MNNAQSNILEQALSVDEKLRGLFMEHYGLNVTDPDDKKSAVGYKAYGLMAVDVAMRLANVFMAINNPKAPRTFQAICDLTYQLNTNDFWHKNASILLPLMHAALNAHRDVIVFNKAREELNEYSMLDALSAAGRAAPLEIFPVIAYCLGGGALMQECSASLKQALAPYLMG